MPTSTDEQKAILEKLKKCKTIPDIQHALDLSELEFARGFYNEMRQGVITAKNQNTDQSKVQIFNLELQHINKTISRINKAIIFAQQHQSRKISATAPQEVVIENEFNFLKKFYELAQSKLHSVAFDEIKMLAVEEYTNRNIQKS